MITYLVGVTMSSADIDSKAFQWSAHREDKNGTLQLLFEKSKRSTYIDLKEGVPQVIWARPE